MVRKTDFDNYARRYDEILGASVKVGGFPPEYYYELKIREVHQFLRSAGMDERPLRILNYGCGIGKIEPYLSRYFPSAVIYSTDVSAESVAVARENNKALSNIHFSPGDGTHVPFEREFDVILVAGVLHHIPRGEQRLVMGELCSRLSENGYLFVFEHNPLNPLTRHVVKTCPFDEGVKLLSPCFTGRLLTDSGFRPCALRFIVFFPQALHALLRLEKYLKSVPFGAQYYVVAKKRGEAAQRADMDEVQSAPLNGDGF